MTISIINQADVVIESMQDSLIVTNTEGHIIYLNYAAEILLDVALTRVLGQRLDEVLNLLPMGTQESVRAGQRQAQSDGTFKAANLQGYWLLRQGNNRLLVNIVVSPLPANADGKASLLYSIRPLKEKTSLPADSLPAASYPVELSQDDFHSRIRNAFRASQRWNQEHSLLCVQFEMGQSREGDCEHIIAVLNRNLRRTDASSHLGPKKMGVLLDGYSLTHAIRRAFELIRILSACLPEKDARRRNLNIWIGVVPVNRFSPVNSNNLIGSAIVACYEAKQAGRGSAVRIYRPSREAVNSNHFGLSPSKGNTR